MLVCITGDRGLVWFFLDFISSYLSARLSTETVEKSQTTGVKQATLLAFQDAFMTHLSVFLSIFPAHLHVFGGVVKAGSIAWYNRTETSGKYSHRSAALDKQLLRWQRRLMECWLILLLGLRQEDEASMEGEGERANVAWKIVCYEAILALELLAAHTHTHTLICLL